MGSITNEILGGIDDRAGLDTIRHRMQDNSSALEAAVNSSPHTRGNARLGTIGTSVLYLSLLAACGGNSSTAPSGTNPPPGNGYVTLDSVLKTVPEGLPANVVMTLQKASQGSDVDIDITNNAIRITADNKIMPGTYTALLKPKPGHESETYQRETPIIIAYNNQLRRYEIKVMLDNASGPRTADLDVIAKSYDLNAYQQGAMRYYVGVNPLRSLRWDGNNCPNNDIHTTLYSNNTKVDKNSMSPEIWNQLMQNVSDNTQAILDALNGNNAGQSGVSYLTGGVCQPKVRLESATTSLAAPSDSSGNRIEFIPDISTAPLVIIESDSQDTVNGRMTYARLYYDVYRKINKATFAIDIGRAYGMNPPKAGLTSGLPLIDNQGNYLPMVFEVSKLKYNRMPNQMSNAQTPDLQGR